MQHQTRKIEKSDNNTDLIKLASTYGGIWIPKEELNNGSRCPTCGIVFDLEASSGKQLLRCYYCDNP